VRVAICQNSPFLGCGQNSNGGAVDPVTTFQNSIAFTNCFSDAARTNLISSINANLSVGATLGSPTELVFTPNPPIVIGVLHQTGDVDACTISFVKGVTNLSQDSTPKQISEAA